MEEQTKKALTEAIVIILITTMICTIIALFLIAKITAEKIQWTEEQICKDNGMTLIKNDGVYLLCYDNNTKYTKVASRTGTIQ